MYEAVIFLTSSKELQFKKDMRVQLSNNEEARNLAEKLLQIGEVIYPTDDVTGQIELTDDLCVIINISDELMDKIYPNVVQNYIN